MIPTRPHLQNPAPRLWHNYPRPYWDYFNAPGRSGYNPDYQNPGDPVGHKGLDLGADEGTDALACLAQTVHMLVNPITNPSAGHGVEAYTPTDGGAWGFRYLHLVEGSILVAAGDTLETGQRFAQVGRTGNANYPHIHFECRWLPGGPQPGSLVSQGIPLDPLSFDLLAITPPVDWPTLLHPGDTHPCVRALRGLLHTLGYLPTQAGDTAYGSRVGAAMKRFQKEHPPLIPNGLVGPQTRAAIVKAIGRALS